MKVGGDFLIIQGSRVYPERGQGCAGGASGLKLVLGTWGLQFLGIGGLELLVKTGVEGFGGSGLHREYREIL